MVIKPKNKDFAPDQSLNVVVEFVAFIFVQPRRNLIHMAGTWLLSPSSRFFIFLFFIFLFPLAIWWVELLWRPYLPPPSPLSVTLEFSLDLCLPISRLKKFGWRHDIWSTILSTFLVISFAIYVQIALKYCWNLVFVVPFGHIFWHVNAVIILCFPVTMTCITFFNYCLWCNSLLNKEW